jgi:hypothetical protein
MRSWHPSFFSAILVLKETYGFGAAQSGNSAG